MADDTDDPADDPRLTASDLDALKALEVEHAIADWDAAERTAMAPARHLFGLGAIVEPAGSLVSHEGEWCYVRGYRVAGGSVVPGTERDGRLWPTWEDAELEAKRRGVACHHQHPIVVYALLGRANDCA